MCGWMDWVAGWVDELVDGCVYRFLCVGPFGDQVIEQLPALAILHDQVELRAHVTRHRPSGHTHTHMPRKEPNKRGDEAYLPWFGLRFGFRFGFGSGLGYHIFGEKSIVQRHNVRVVVRGHTQHSFYLAMKGLCTHTKQIGLYMHARLVSIHTRNSSNENKIAFC